jgi:colanic acid biosynthesis glycosyl transferase WcaI
MGRPIIMGVRGESREIVKAAGAAIEMEPESETDLVHGLLKLADDVAFCESLSHSARAYVLEHYDRSQQAARMLSVFEELVS